MNVIKLMAEFESMIKNGKLTGKENVFFEAFPYDGAVKKVAIEITYVEGKHVVLRRK